MISAASAAVAVEGVGTACTLPDSDSRSNPPAVGGSPVIQSTLIIPLRSDGSGSGWRRPCDQQCSAFVYWHDLHVLVLVTS